jgi:hypothetical protein
MDKDNKFLTRMHYPVTIFNINTPGWVEIDIPDIDVTDEFSVWLFTSTARKRGIHIGADNSVTNEHSDFLGLVQSQIKILEKWPYSSDLWFGDKSKVNWMIRVVGSYSE